MKQINVSSSDIDNFRVWLELNLDSISWEGRYIKEFELFWDNLLPADKDASFLISRILFCKKKSVSGPLAAWFNWLTERFLCFLFLNKDLSIYDLGKISGMGERNVSLVLRDFFIDNFPHLEEDFNEKLHIGNITSNNLYLTFKELRQEVGIEEVIHLVGEEQILKSLEITLYEDWKSLSLELGRLNREKQAQLDILSKKATYKKQLRFFRELALLFLVGGLLILTIKAGNKYYEDYLVKEISLFEPNFFWLDKNLSFNVKDPLGSKDVELSYKELENLEKIESKKVFNDAVGTSRFEVESDVTLTSVDSLPKDFTSADLEQSEYEEKRKGGYRNSAYGRRLAYRVMMTSVSPKETKSKVLEALKYFNVKQVDNVKPGTSIPGGLYFNLYVPMKEIKDFLSKVSNIEESTILESKTVFGGPSGTNKVFIWIKGI